jgi:hypothetical protein
MRPDDKDKLNKCLDILDTTDLGLSLVWLWTWSTAKGFLEDSEWVAIGTEDQLWEALCKAVEGGMGFSLEYGAEDHYEAVKEWMLDNNLISEPEEDE